MQKNRALVVGASLLFVLGMVLIAVAGELEPQAYLPVVYNPPPTPTAQPTATPSPSLVNGNFESGHAGWLEYSAIGYPIIVHDGDLPSALNPHGGQWATWFGGDDDELAAIIQEFTVPASAQTLTYYRWIASNDICNADYDIAGVIMDDDGDVTEDDVLDAFILCDGTSTNGWRSRSLNIAPYAGKRVELTFLASTDNVIVSSLFVDDVVVGGSGLTGEEEAPGVVFGPPERPAIGDAVAVTGGSANGLQALESALREQLVDVAEGAVQYKE